MINRLFRKENNCLSLEFLHHSPIKEQYFIRVAQWDWLDPEHITVLDPNSPQVFTLDPWPQWIFLDATGQSMVKEYVYHWVDRYNGALPKQLDLTILDTIQQLVSYGIIQLVDRPQAPDPLFDLPRSAQENL